MTIRHCLAALLTLLSACLASAQGLVERADCVSQPEDTVATCGYISLPLDYVQPAGARIEIYYTQLHSPAAKPDPLVYLVGGPGSSGTQLMSVSYDKYLSAFAAERDIIIIDQRGTGMSNPPLYCREALFRLGDILSSPRHRHAELQLEILGACRDRLASNGVQFEAFHTVNNARDVVTVLLALGYERWNLVGVSYGTRLALEIMRESPQHLRSVILDSVYPPQADIYMDAYYHGERALDKLFEACARARSCDMRYPQLRTLFYRLYDQLNETPLHAPYKPPNARRVLIEISGNRLYDWVFSWLYEVPAIQLIPKLLYELARGRTDNAANVGAVFEGAMTSLSLGMHYALQCQEEYATLPARDYAALLAEHPHLSDFLDYPVQGRATLPRLCEMWGGFSRPFTANEPVYSAVPTLLLSGDFDPITPPVYADMAAQTLDNAWNYTLPHVGHAALRSHDCAVGIAVAFINAPQQEPDASCIERMKPLRFR